MFVQVTRVLHHWSLAMIAPVVAAYLTRTSDSYARLWDGTGHTAMA